MGNYYDNTECKYTTTDITPALHGLYKNVFLQILVLNFPVKARAYKGFPEKANDNFLRAFDSHNKQIDISPSIYKKTAVFAL